MKGLQFQRRLCILIFLFGLANFLVFVIAAIWLRGDALNGHAVDGRYFLASHGQLTEVDRAVFVYSEWHARSLFVTHPLAMIAGCRLNQLKQANQL